jgi:hypothetical protein
MILARSLPRFRFELTERNRAHVIVAVASFLLAVVLLGTAVLQDGGAKIDSANGQSFETQRLINERGGYELEAPSSWQVSRRGPATTMSSPRDDIFVTVGRAPKGRLAIAANDIFDSIADTYARVTFMGAAEQIVDERDAVVFSGKATNQQDVRLRFVGVVFTDGERNYSMTAFARADTEPGRVLPRIEKILNTFAVTKR